MNYLALKFPGGETITTTVDTAKFGSLGAIISSFLPYVFALAGLTLLLYLIFGGFQYLVSGGDPKSTESAKGKITSAVAGFIIIFVSYWVFQIVGILLGVNFFQPTI